MNFAVSADQRVKLKESKKKDKYVDFTKELKKKQKTMEHECVICAVCTVTNGLEQKLEDLKIRGRVETIHNTEKSMDI